MFWVDDLPDQTIGRALAGALARFGDREALTFGHRRLTFRDVKEQSDLIACAFLRLGVRRGDRVAIWMASHPEWAALYFGLLRIGAVLVPLNTRFKPDEIEYALAKSGAKALIFKREVTGDKDYGKLLLEILPELEVQSGTLHARRAPLLRHVIDVAESPMTGTLGLAELVDRGKELPADDLQIAELQVNPQDEALIQFTSGTTAFPKGARLCHAGMLRGAGQTLDWLQMRESDVYFSAQPFYHSGGSVATMLAPIISGCRTVTLTYFEPGEALAMMEAERATVMVGHQPHFIEYLNHPTLSRRRLWLERMLVIAPPEIFWMVYEKLGLAGLVSGYGMTETHLFGTATSLLTDPMEVRFNTNGRPNPGVQMQIRDPDDGTVLEPGERGEIFLRVPYPMLGYFDEPQLTADVLDRDGWYRSGDAGVVGKDGTLRLLGRVRDMIRVGGENLAGAEVEACLLKHPAVKQAAAIAAPDARLGEVVIAFVELKDEAAVPGSELIDHCKAKLASFKVPRAVHFVTEWPMSGTGKIQKRLLLKTLS